MIATRALSLAKSIANTRNIKADANIKLDIRKFLIPHYFLFGS